MNWTLILRSTFASEASDGNIFIFRLFGLGNSFEFQVPTLLYTYSGICNHSPCELRISQWECLLI